MGLSKKSVWFLATLMQLLYQEQRGDNSALFQSGAIESEKHISGRMAANWSASREGQIGW